MAYVITEPCIGTCDTSCVKICPVDCIHGPKIIEEAEGFRSPSASSYSRPSRCTSSPRPASTAGLVPECPVDAIFEENEVPSKWQSYIAKNADYFKDKNSDFLKDKNAGVAKKQEDSKKSKRPF